MSREVPVSRATRERTVRSHSKKPIMKIYLKKLLLGQVILIFTLVCFALSPRTWAVDPALNGGYPKQNTVEEDDALFSLATDADDTAMGFDALYRNKTGSDNPLASWIWRATGSLNTAHADHTATLLENGMVLVAGGQDTNFRFLARAELGHGDR